MSTWLEFTMDAEEFLYGSIHIWLCKLKENNFNYVKHDLESLNAIISKQCFLKKVVALANISQKVLNQFN